MTRRSPQSCSRCGRRISADAPEGNCPQCLLDLGFGLEGEIDQAGVLPRRFGDYVLVDEIGRGGMGVIYRARHLPLNRMVAVKMILHGPFANPGFIKRFRAEAEAVATLQHPHIVAIHEVGEQDGCHFFSMDLVEGRNLAELARERPLPAGVAARYLQTIAQAIEFAHQRGILHRDLKPSNILIDELDQPRLTDFGLAKQLNDTAEMTLTGQVLGSPNYFPPEQADRSFGSVGCAADVYSLGAILYHLLSGRPPYVGETIPQVIEQVLRGTLVPPRWLNPGVPRALETICLKCLAREPHRRYGSAGELAMDLERFLAGKPICARSASPTEKAALWAKRHPAWAALVVASLLGVSGVSWEWRRAEHLAQAEAAERLLASAISREAQLKLYAADMSATALALDRGDFGLARRLLQEHRPKPGQTDLREFSWRFLSAQAKGDQLATLGAHGWIVTCTAFSPDGSILATGSQDQTVKLWDPIGRGLLATLPHAGAVWSLGFTPDGQRLMSAASDGKVRLWNVASKQVIRCFPGRIAALSPVAPLVATDPSSSMWWESAGPVCLWNWQTGQKVLELPIVGRALAFSPDGQRLAIGGAERNVYLWDIAGARLIRTFPTDKTPWHLAFSVDGATLVELGWTKDILVWRLDRDEPAQHLTRHTLDPWWATFSPDGKVLASCGSDQTIRLWDATTLEPTAVLRGHGSEVWSIAFSPDGRTLASGGKDQKVMLWNAAPPPPKRSFACDNGFKPIFSADGRLMATSGLEHGIWGATVVDLKAQSQSTLITNVLPLGFSSDDQVLLCVDLHEPVLQSWSLPDLKLEQSVPLAASLPNSGLLFAQLADRGRLCFGEQTNGRLGLWSATDGHLVAAFQGPLPPVRSARVSPSSRWIAVTVEREKVIHLFDTKLRSEKLLQGHHDFISDLDFSPDERTVATASVDGTVKLWDTPSGTEQASLTGHMEEATDVSFSPDGRTLASLEQGQAIKLWHIPTLRELLTLNIPAAGLHLCFCPDGSTLAFTTAQDVAKLLRAPLVATP